MSQEFMNELTQAMDEVKENPEVMKDSEAEALELEAVIQETESSEDTADIPKSIEDVLQLNEAEKQAYQNIGNAVENMPVEGRIVGYKRGSCYDRLIPIND